MVYITAFAPDKGESVASLIKSAPPGAPVPPILPPQDGFLFLDKAKFPAAFAADVSPDKASFMADSQVPWGVEALGGAITQPAWRTKPSWYLVTTEDKMIPPDAQRAMSKRAGSTVVEVKSSHSVYPVASSSRRSSYRAGRNRCLGGNQRRRNECCRRLGFKSHTGFDEAEISQRVMHAYGTLNLVEPSLKRRPSCWRIIKAGILSKPPRRSRLTVVKCPALKRMGEQGKFNLPA